MVPPTNNPHKRTQEDDWLGLDVMRPFWFHLFDTCIYSKNEFCFPNLLTYHTRPIETLLANSNVLSRPWWPLSSWILCMTRDPSWFVLLGLHVMSKSYEDNWTIYWFPIASNLAVVRRTNTLAFYNCIQFHETKYHWQWLTLHVDTILTTWLDSSIKLLLSKTILCSSKFSILFITGSLCCMALTSTFDIQLESNNTSLRTSVFNTLHCTNPKSTVTDRQTAWTTSEFMEDKRDNAQQQLLCAAWFILYVKIIWRQLSDLPMSCGIQFSGHKNLS